MGLINDFFNITQIQVDNSRLEFKSTEIKPLIEEIVSNVEPEATRRGITIVRPNSPSWPTISLDQRRIKEVIFILLDNAIRYNKDGGKIVMDARVEKGAKGDEFVLVVENTGIILSAADKDKVMAQPFYRAVEAQKINPSGTGVGLVTAKSIMEAHKGSFTIGVDEKEPMTKLEMRLPLSQ